MSRIALNENLSALLAYWRAKCRGRAMPARADIDPAEIPHLLPHLMLIDMPGGRLRFRLVGEQIESTYGISLTGKFVADVVPRDRYEKAKRAFDSVIDTGRPVASRSLLITPRGTELDATRLILPLTLEGETIEMFLVGLQLAQAVVVGDPALGIETTIRADMHEIEFV